MITVPVIRKPMIFIKGKSSYEKKKKRREKKGLSRQRQSGSSDKKRPVREVKRQVPALCFFAWSFFLLLSVRRAFNCGFPVLPDSSAG